MTKRGMEKRRIGQTALEVTSLGLGGASLAGIFSPVPRDQARATVVHALANGINYVDTAPQSGLGLSEHLVGEPVRDAAQRPIISTKVGRLLRPVKDGVEDRGNWAHPLPFNQYYDYSYDGIMRSFEDSQQRLGLDRVDILYVHDIGVMTHGVEGNKPYWEQLSSGGYHALRELRDSGTVKAIGLGVNEWEVLMDAFALGDWDVFLLAGRYTLLEQTSLSPFMTTCMERKASVVIGGPFNSGVLVGGDKFNYAKAPDDVMTKVRAIQAVCESYGVPLPAAALQFPLTHPAVCNVLPGPRSPAELDGILDWWDAEIPEALWTSLADEGLLAPGTPIPGGVA
jgi:D-threo-aldose 1-dehydrogenase